MLLTIYQYQILEHNPKNWKIRAWINSSGREAIITGNGNVQCNFCESFFVPNDFSHHICIKIMNLDPEDKDKRKLSKIKKIELEHY